MSAADSDLAFLPSWFRDYDRSRFRGDLAAGLIVGVVLIPQGMAYALLAGVPPVYGLYASLIPLLVYALFGSSRHLAVGVVAIDSLIVAAGIAALSPETPTEALGLTFTLALMVGLIQMAMGALRFAFVVNLLSRPVITGFTSAASLIIGLSQLKHLLGVELDRNLNVFSLLLEATEKLGGTHLPSLSIGLGGILFLVFSRKFFPRLPAPLLVVVLSALAVVALNLGEKGVSLVGVIPVGLPEPGIPAFSIDAVRSLLPTAITLSLVQFMGVISLGKVFAAKHGYRVQPSRELIVLGAMNTVGSMFQSIPVSGSFSRSAVNDRAGAQTSLANAIAAVLVGLVLLFLTPLFAWLPIPVFASIIMVSAFGLIDLAEVRLLMKTKALDGIIALLTFVATLTLGIYQGILVGIGLSVIAIMYRITRPNVAVLGLLPATRSFRDTVNHAGAKQFDDVLILRIDASFSFANADRLRDVITTGVNDTGARAVILDASSINDLDTTALSVLEETFRILQNRNVLFLIAGARQSVLDILEHSSAVDTFSNETFFLSPWRALHHVLTMWGRQDELASH